MADAVHGSPDAPLTIGEATVRYVRPAMIGTTLDIEIPVDVRAGIARV